MLVAAVVLLGLGIAAGVYASNNKEGKPSTVVNQQTTSTVNSLGVSVQAPAHESTKTVTAPTQTVTAPTKTVTAPAQTVTSTTKTATTTKTTTPSGATP